MKYFIQLLLSLSIILNAGEYKKSTDLFELSLEELMNIEITTVSKEKESIPESLAIVSVLTSKQIKELGVINLYEAISYLPGVQVNETYMGYSVITFRGVHPGLYNNKALFMVNGHPVHEKLFGSSHFEFVPLEMVERIEVVRSPSSVLYGTNAVSGVVNVITKQQTNEVAIRYGSNNHYYGSLSVHDTHLSVAASYQNDDGYDYGNGLKDEVGQDIDKNYKNDLKNIFVDFHKDQWRIQGSYYNSKKEKLGLNPIIQHGGINDYEAFYIDVNKKFNLGDGVLSIWARYDKMDKELHTQKFPNYLSGNEITVENSLERYSGELQYKDYISDSLNYIVGASYEYDKTQPMLFVDQTTLSPHPWSPFQSKHFTTNLAVYGEAKYRFNDKLIGVAGLRFEDNRDTDSEFNPRFGLNYRYADDTYFKLLYSEAYRSPTFLEKYAEVEGILMGYKDLKREKIKTVELGVDTKIANKNSLKVTAYYLELSDEITRRVALAGGTEYYNAKGAKNYGFEITSNNILNKNTQLMLNLSNVNERHDDEPTHDNMQFVAKFTANAMITYKLNDGLSGSFVNQYIDSKGDIDSYNLTNITLKYTRKKLEANLYIKNIFSEDYTYPEPVRRNISQMPGGDSSRSVYLTARYYF